MARLLEQHTDGNPVVFDSSGLNRTDAEAVAVENDKEISQIQDQAACPWRPTKAPTGSAKSERPKKAMTQARKRNQFMTEMFLARAGRVAGTLGFAP